MIADLGTDECGDVSQNDRHKVKKCGAYVRKERKPILEHDHPDKMDGKEKKRPFGEIC